MNLLVAILIGVIVFAAVAIEQSIRLANNRICSALDVIGVSLQTILEKLDSTD